MQMPGCGRKAAALCGIALYTGLLGVPPVHRNPQRAGCSQCRDCIPLWNCNPPPRDECAAKPTRRGPCRRRATPALGKIIMHRILPILLALGLAACANAKPDTVASPRLDSGITSSDGGGMRALGNDPDVGVSTRVGRPQ